MIARMAAATFRLAGSSAPGSSPPADAERLAATVPGARPVWIDGALTFSPLDRPDSVADAVRLALADSTASGTARTV